MACGWYDRTRLKSTSPQLFRNPIIDHCSLRPTCTVPSISFSCSGSIQTMSSALTLQNLPQCSQRGWPSTANSRRQRMCRIITSRQRSLLLVGSLPATNVSCALKFQLDWSEPQRSNQKGTCNHSICACNFKRFQADTFPSRKISQSRTLRVC